MHHRLELDMQDLLEQRPHDFLLCQFAPSLPYLTLLYITASDCSRTGDIATCYADTEKAETLLGWKAASSLDDMCRGWYTNTPLVLCDYVVIN